MYSMVVTLDVSKLSGWLNATALCRPVEKRAYDMRGEVRGREAWEGMGRGGRRPGMHGKGPTQGWGERACAERTSNMRYMSVTLDVSKLSGWLNADASCRVERRACDAGRGVGREACGRGVAAPQAACTGRGIDSRLGVRARAERTTTIWYMKLSGCVLKSQIINYFQFSCPQCSNRVGY